MFQQQRIYVAKDNLKNLAASMSIPNIPEQLSGRGMIPRGVLSGPSIFRRGRMNCHHATWAKAGPHRQSGLLPFASMSIRAIRQRA